MALISCSKSTGQDYDNASTLERILTDLGQHGQTTVFTNDEWQSFNSVYYPNDHTCTICVDVFDDQDRRPIELTCGHAHCCSRCLTSYIEVQLSQSHGKTYHSTGVYSMAKLHNHIEIPLTTSERTTRCYESSIHQFACPYRCKDQGFYLVEQHRTTPNLALLTLSGHHFRLMPSQAKLKAMVDLKVWIERRHTQERKHAAIQRRQEQTRKQPSRWYSIGHLLIFPFRGLWWLW